MAKRTCYTCLKKDVCVIEKDTREAVDYGTKFSIISIDKTKRTPKNFQDIFDTLAKACTWFYPIPNMYLEKREKEMRERV